MSFFLAPNFPIYDRPVYRLSPGRAEFGWVLVPAAPENIYRSRTEIP